VKRIVLASLVLAAVGLAGVPVAAPAGDAPVQFLNSPGAGTGKLPFSEAVRVGNIVFLSGQIGVDTSTNALVPGGIREQARQTMENIQRSLVAHGFSMRDVVKCTVMLADISEWQAFNEVYVTYFSRPYPARSAFAANGLALGARVEVECIAAAGREI